MGLHICLFLGKLDYILLIVNEEKEMYNRHQITNFLSELIKSRIFFDYIK